MFLVYSGMCQRLLVVKPCNSIYRTGSEADQRCPSDPEQISVTGAGSGSTDRTWYPGVILHMDVPERMEVSGKDALLAEYSADCCRCGSFCVDKQAGD